MDAHVISFRTLRRLIGVLGILLPWACWAANALVNNLDLLNNKKLAILSGTNPYMPMGNLKSSISHFYYTASAPLFIGIIVTVAIFLFCYKGYDYQKDRDKTPWLSDRRVCTLAAIFALGIVIFPTGEDFFISDSLYVFTVTHAVGIVHYVFAGLFFLAIAILCLVNFRRKEHKEQFGHDKHDLFYRICGWVIIGSIVFIFVYHRFLEAYLAFEWPVTFVFEAIALTAFGLAWLLKGKTDEMVKEMFSNAVK